MFVNGRTVLLFTFALLISHGICSSASNKNSTNSEQKSSADEDNKIQVLDTFVSKNTSLTVNNGQNGNSTVESTENENITVATTKPEPNVTEAAQVTTKKTTEVPHVTVPILTTNTQAQKTTQNPTNYEIITKKSPTTAPIKSASNSTATSTTLNKPTPSSTSTTTTTTISTTVLEIVTTNSIHSDATTISSTTSTESVTETSAKPTSMSKPSEKMSVGYIALTATLTIFISITVTYFGLVLWRRYLEYRYGNRQLLVNEMEFDSTTDFRHFEL